MYAIRNLAKALTMILVIALSLAKNARAGEDPTDYRPYCRGVDLSLSKADKQALAPTIARQLKEYDELHQDRTVRITDSLRYGGWWLLAIQDGLGDGAFLFYPDNPKKKTFITTWGGAAGVDEGPEMETWTIDNVPGIPKHLARCFSRYVLTHATG